MLSGSTTEGPRGLIHTSVIETSASVGAASVVRFLGTLNDSDATGHDGDGFFHRSWQESEYIYTLH